MIARMIDDAMNHQSIIAILKSKSKYYPEVVLETFGSTVNGETRTVNYASTLVRIERDGVWYTVHCVETYVSSQMFPDKAGLLLNLMRNAHNVMHLHKLCGRANEDVDKDQSSEEERLATLIRLELIRYKG